MVARPNLIFNAIMIDGKNLANNQLNKFYADFLTHKCQNLTLRNIKIYRDAGKLLYDSHYSLDFIGISQGNSFIEVKGNSQFRLPSQLRIQSDIDKAEYLTSGEFDFTAVVKVEICKIEEFEGIFKTLQVLL